MSHTISLVIYTFNWPEALNLVLKSIQQQTKFPDEILIADGGSSKLNKPIIQKFAQYIPTPIIHMELEKNEEPSKSKILNKAILKSQSDYIIQINANCILHKNFVYDHSIKAKSNIFLYGISLPVHSKSIHTVIQNEIIKFSYFSGKIKRSNKNLRIPFLSNFNSPINYFSEEMTGNNVSFWKKDFMDINGYNEDFMTQTGEDIDFFYRLLFSGIKGKKLSHLAILYFLPNPSTDDADKLNTMILKKTKKYKIIVCANGVEKIKKNKKIPFY